MSSLNSSLDLFKDSVDSEELKIDQNEAAWYGIPLEEIKFCKNTNYIDNFYPVQPSKDHHIMFKVPLVDDIPQPFPDEVKDVWSDTHVRMPFSPHSLFPVSETELESRWSLIKSAFTRKITNSKELEAAIFSYNSNVTQKWSLDALHIFFSETVSQEEGELFFTNILPGIMQLALRIEDMFKSGLPLLASGRELSISLSQEQVAVLLANAFLSTFPRRNGNHLHLKYPCINFNRLFQCSKFACVQEKIKCFINYFRRVLDKCPKGVITFSRRYLSPNSLPMWATCEEQLPALYISSEGVIENEGRGLLEVDFANKNVGGGILGRGSVQEEIKFLLCPELVVARLFTEALGDTEALIVTGCERFNSHEGYSDGFTWAGNYHDETERDSFRRIKMTMVAIDATRFSSPKQQYSKEAINRELNKAYAGFSAGGNSGSPGISTGNWGCGVYRGDPRLKSLIQLMAAGVAGKTVAYFTFGDRELAKDVYDMWYFLRSVPVTIGTLWKILTSYAINGQPTNVSLYDHVYLSLGHNRGRVKDITFKLTTKEEKAQGITNQGVIEEKRKSKLNGGNVLSEKEKDIVTETVKRSEETVSGKEPVNGETCSLQTKEGRKRALEDERVRWAAYRAAMDSYCSNEQPPTKRKISDYFIKINKPL